AVGTVDRRSRNRQRWSFLVHLVSTDRPSSGTVARNIANGAAVCYGIAGLCIGGGACRQRKSSVGGRICQVRNGVTRGARNVYISCMPNTIWGAAHDWRRFVQIDSERRHVRRFFASIGAFRRSEEHTSELQSLR